EPEARDDEDALPPLDTAEGWAKAGLDPSLDAAAFSWPDRARGALFVLPVADRARFRAAFKAKTRREGGRDVDEVIGGYTCATAIGRVLCAKKLADVDAAAALHASPVAYGAEHLHADDTGDVEIYATPKAPHLADMAKDMKDYGTLHGVASVVRLRDDGASLRVHVMGELHSALARALAGVVPPKERPLAAGAPSVLRVHVDPIGATEKMDDLDAEDRHELVEQLTGDAEVTTSGRGLIGAYAAFDLRGPARVEAYVKKKCKEAGGYKVGSGLRAITVTEHGCAAVFDPKLALVPVSIDPIPVSAEVHGAKLVVTIGGAAAPSPAERTIAGVAPDTDAAFAVADQEAIVAFTKSPWIGPEVGAGDTFRKMFWFVGKRAGARLDGFNDVAAHVAQAFVAARVAEDGVIVNAGFVTFQRDPPEAQRAYDAALAARARRADAEYASRLADVERRFPGTLVAQRAAEVRTAGPFLGAGVMSLGSVGVWLRALDSLTDLSRWKD
ncbi:MAG TPA: hypothetical protein VHB21_28345, partial [Minicystis sp.]|nr:hypothetical protein [Minicystis sp.]